MNFLDIIIIIVLILLTLGALILQFMAVSEQEYGMVGGVFVTWLVLCGFIFCVSFVNIDKKSGSTVGIYSTGACDDAPVDVIAVLNEEKYVEGN